MARGLPRGGQVTDQWQGQTHHANDLQQKAMKAIGELHNGELACQMAGRTLVCEVEGVEGNFKIDPDASFIAEPSGRITDLAELEQRISNPELFAADPFYEPDDEYEAEFTGRSPYRASSATDDPSMARGTDDDAHAFAAQQRADRWVD